VKKSTSRGAQAEKGYQCLWCWMPGQGGDVPGVRCHCPSSPPGDRPPRAPPFLFQEEISNPEIVSLRVPPPSLPPDYLVSTVLFFFPHLFKISALIETEILHFC